MDILNDEWYLRHYRGNILQEKYGVFGIFSVSSQVRSIAFGHTSHAQLERDFTTLDCPMIGGGAMAYEQNQIRVTGNTFNNTHPPLSDEIIEITVGIIRDILHFDSVLVVPRNELVRKKR